MKFRPSGIGRSCLWSLPEAEKGSERGWTAGAHDEAGAERFAMAVIRVLADKKQTQRTAGLKKRTYENREFEAFTISWLPQNFRMASAEVC